MFSERPAAAFLIVLAASSCSVKEDMSGCDAFVELDLSKVPYTYLCEEDYDVLQVNAFSLDKFDNLSLMTEDRVSEAVLRVPRGKAEVSAFCGAEDYYSPETGMIIPEGRASPELYLYHSSLELDGERVRDVVVLRKSFCRLRVHFKNSQDFGLSVEGNVDGYDLRWRPHEGRFTCAMKRKADGVYEIVLPRQKDNTLSLNVIEGRKVIKGFALGKVMAESGYDWDAVELEDIELTVDYAASTAVVNTSLWKEIKEETLVL